MICGKCGQQTATVHMTQIVNNEKKEIYLCQNCAVQPDLPFSFENFFQGLLDTFQSQQQQKQTGAPEHAAVQCPKCGLTHEDFKNTGRFGCADCYGAFREHLNGIFKNIQAGQSHEGKFPKRHGIQLNRQKKSQQLKKALAKAIEDEEYESAAVLRDEIRALESVGSVGEDNE